MNSSSELNQGKTESEDLFKNLKSNFILKKLFHNF